MYCDGTSVRGGVEQDARNAIIPHAVATKRLRMWDEWRERGMNSEDKLKRQSYEQTPSCGAGRDYGLKPNAGINT
jgi:hypothetical protein